jgi:O-antigen/teichoic acid export membrane protein
LSKNRAKKLALNTVTSLALQFITLICGFILPRLILESYGSDVNGLVNSVTQFLGVVSLLDLGVGTVVQSSLYKPLADRDNTQISKIYVSATKFFKRLAVILLVYVVVLIGIYPFIVNKSFGFVYTATLIVAISISSFAQYYFGIVNSLLLSADQKGYIQYSAQIITLIVNTIACVVLIKVGCSIQIVKFTTSLIFITRPFFLNWYVRHNYSINKKITYEEEPIKQKWNGMAQHFAAYVLNGTDNIVLTLFSTLADVSIYFVYNLVINGVFMIITSLTSGFTSYFGNLWARQEKENLKNKFKFFEWIVHTSTVLIFGCTGMLILKFVKVYTLGINDAEYVQPLFATVITIAFAVRSLRIPYNYLILSAGHYKQTQSNYIIAMFLNIVISIIAVKKYGLVGVACGTLIAMLYQTLWMAWYDYKNLINFKITRFIKQVSIDVIIVIIGFFTTFKVEVGTVNYISWLLQAIIVFAVWSVVVFFTNIICYKNEMYFLMGILKRRIKK